MNYQFTNFQLWLKSKGFSDSTVRNYVLDLGKYLEFVNQLPQLVSFESLFTPDVISLYVAHITDKNNSSRQLASLRKFCQFALDQRIISSDPFNKIKQDTPPISFTDLPKLYTNYLTKHNTPISTIRNYINDLNQYIVWLGSQNNQ